MKRKQVGSPTKARAGFLKIGLPLNWKASVGFTKWGTVYSLIWLAKAGWQGWNNKARLARPGWQGQVGKARSDQTGRIGKIGQRKQRVK